MKPVEFHPEAAAELDAAVGYYEQCVPGLGIDLRKDVEAAVRKNATTRRKGPTNLPTTVKAKKQVAHGAN